MSLTSAQLVEHDVAHEVVTEAREEMDATLGALLQHPNVMRALAFATRHLPAVGSPPIR